MKKILHKHPDEHSTHNHPHEHEHCHDDNCTHEHHHHHHHHEHKEPFIIPRRDQNQLSFDNFLQLFPAAEYPISISSDTQRLLSGIQEPLAEQWVARFLLPEGTQIDEFTEFMACFSLPETPKFHALIYWEASLIGSSYYLVTFSRSGLIIDHQRIAGTLYTDNEVVQTVCTIQSDGTIHQIEAKMDAHSGNIIKQEKPIQTYWELTEAGRIVD